MAVGLRWGELAREGNAMATCKGGRASSVRGRRREEWAGLGGCWAEVG